MSDTASWQPIETAPRDGKSILLTDGECVSEGGWLSEVVQGDYGGWWNVACIEKPTHWMPLPTPPEESA